MKVRIRDKNCPTNPKKMLSVKIKIFKYKVLMWSSVSINLILAGYIFFNN